MLEELKSIDESEAQMPPGVTRPELPNRLPEPYREITEDEFWHRWGTYTPRYTEYDQVRLEPENLMAMVHGVHIFWYHDCGLAIVKPNNWECSDREKTGYYLHWKDRPRFFYIGCDHVFKTFDREYAQAHGLPYTAGRCYTNCVCEKCGVIGSYDSSD